jgi:hypothetical protein
MTLQELKDYIKNKRKQNAQQWAAEKKEYGDCTPFTFKEYMEHQNIIVSGKRTYKTKFVHNKLWTITK